MADDEIGFVIAEFRPFGFAEIETEILLLDLADGQQVFLQHAEDDQQQDPVQGRFLQERRLGRGESVLDAARFDADFRGKVLIHPPPVPGHGQEDHGDDDPDGAEAEQESEEGAHQPSERADDRLPRRRINRSDQASGEGNAHGIGSIGRLVDPAPEVSNPVVPKAALRRSVVGTAEGVVARGFGLGSGRKGDFDLDPFGGSGDVRFPVPGGLELQGGVGFILRVGMDHVPDADREVEGALGAGGDRLFPQVDLHAGMDVFGIADIGDGASLDGGTGRLFPVESVGHADVDDVDGMASRLGGERDEITDVNRAVGGNGQFRLQERDVEPVVVRPDGGNSGGEGEKDRAEKTESRSGRQRSPFRLLLDLVFAVAIGAGREHRPGAHRDVVAAQLGSAVAAFQQFRIDGAAEVDLLLDDHRFLPPGGQVKHGEGYDDQDDADDQAASGERLGQHECQSHEENDEGENGGDDSFHDHKVADRSLFFNL